MLWKMYKKVIYDEKVYERITLWGSTPGICILVFWVYFGGFRVIFDGVFATPPSLKPLRGEKVSAKTKYYQDCRKIAFLYFLIFCFLWDFSILCFFWSFQFSAFYIFKFSDFSDFFGQLEQGLRQPVFLFVFSFILAAGSRVCLAHYDLGLR